MIKKKICILSTVHEALDVRIFKQAKALAEAEFDVTLIAQYPQNEAKDNINIIALPKPRNRVCRFFGMFRVFFIVLRQKPYICHFHDPELIFIGFFLKMFGKKIIYDVHEDVPSDILGKRWIPRIFRTLTALTFSFVEKLIARSFNQIITVGDFISKKFKNKNISEIHNYPSLLDFPKRSLLPSKKEIKIIYSGILDELRCIKEIIEAMGYIDEKYNCKLILAGKFNDPAYEKKIRSLEGFKLVDFKGFLEYNELKKLLIQCNIGILCFKPIPNQTESLPNKLFEYLAAGLAIVASNFLLWEDILIKNNCGVTVNPEDPKFIAEGIEKIISQNGKLEQMSQNAFILSKNYSWESEKEKLLAVYKRLCQE